MDSLSNSRRAFLQVAAGAGTLAAAAEIAPSTGMPTVKFGAAEISRLIIGSNPFYGYTHFNNLYNAFMREYMTQDRRMDVLHRCERAGIKTWQFHYMGQSVEDFQRYRAEGGKMNWFLLADSEMLTDLTLVAKVAKEMKPIGIAHHGNRTDDYFRAGDMSKVRDFCKAVRDSGVMTGVSTHNPAVVDSVESGGWDIDYFMTCMYRVTRTKDEARQQFGESSMGEIYMEKDPERMTKMVRQTKRPCLAFKLLAAGRSIERPQHVAAAFKYVFENIKPSDAVIVGMCAKTRDEISENAALAVKFGRLG